MNPMLCQLSYAAKKFRTATVCSEREKNASFYNAHLKKIIASQVRIAVHPTILQHSIFIVIPYYNYRRVYKIIFWFEFTVLGSMSRPQLSFPHRFAPSLAGGGQEFVELGHGYPFNVPVDEGNPRALVLIIARPFVS